MLERYSRGSDSSLRWRLNQELHREARMVSAGSLARVLRATGRVDIRSLREEQLEQALSYESLAPYLRQYLRAERVRTMLILPL